MYNMGQEIEKTAFSEEEFLRFSARLNEETDWLATWIKNERCSSAGPVIGCELETWLVDEAMAPAPLNEEYLAILANTQATPELARFNVEFNTVPLKLQGLVFSLLRRELGELWNKAYETARKLDLHLLMIGVLPTLRDEHLIPANMSSMKRYHALNEQILKITGQSIALDVAGHEHLRVIHRDVMLEAATTSFQIHLQYPLSRIRHIYNAAIQISAILVAVGQNSPFLFGRNLWGETRIALFEQAIPVGGFASAAKGPLHRVGFGSGYARHCISECFFENLEHYPVLLPICQDLPAEALFHLRLHNGTIWRWNRPVVGFDADGLPHVRIEHRAIPAGPSIVDSVANAAFYCGLVEMLGVGEPGIPFDRARDNFYRAAQHGLEAHIQWTAGESVRIRHLILKQLLPMAREGLQQLGIAAAEAAYYLGLIEARVASGLTGSAWQRRYMAKYPDDFARMTAAYLHNQLEGCPVHEWNV